MIRSEKRGLRNILPERITNYHQTQNEPRNKDEIGKFDAEKTKSEEHDNMYEI